MSTTHPRTPQPISEFLFALALPASLIFSFYILKAGLSGSFLFDDFSNLEPLGRAHGLVDSYHEIMSFLTGNISGPTGRPVSLLTFLINQYGWPGDATSFLWTNLMLHLLTGVAVFQFTRLCIKSVRQKAAQDNELQNNLLPLLACSLWLVLPLQISTVFYVIQRMTQLSALFTLASLSLYISGRHAIENDRPKRGIAFLVACPLAALIGFYAKENAAIAPILIVILEATVLSSSDTSTKNPLIRRLVVFSYGIAPMAIILFYLAISTVKHGSTWTAGFGRVLLQGEVLLNYMYKIIIPQNSTSGLFYDSFISTPPSAENIIISAIGWATIAALVIIALCARKRFPLIAFGFLFFFAGHLIESSGLSLDLYYEHRNYLPSTGLIIAGLRGINILYNHKKKLAFALFATLFATNAAQAHLRASLWGKPQLAATVWTIEAPKSSSAWLRLSFVANRYNNVMTLRYALTQWQKNAPSLLAPRLLTLRLNCPRSPLDPDRVKALITMAKHTPEFNGLNQYLEPLIRQAASGECEGLSVEQSYYIIRALLDNPKFGIWQKKYLWTLAGYILASKGIGHEAYNAFKQANKLVYDPRMREKQESGLRMAGFPELAKALASERFKNDRPTRFGELHIRTLMSHILDWDTARQSGFPVPPDDSHTKLQNRTEKTKEILLPAGPAK
ncbi:hypothetical protein [Arhodomonas aquaeolei]|uniref:hypothetical protein n=1 Tax=Arhodomonas aquaeolei TaxID=2369 RepID=UPI0003A78070|nr:hypothetical protein [Arhodomonas aquaeolei]